VSIWALLIAKRTLRGEEAAGRWELFLSGRTTGRRATAGALAGLGTGLLLIYLLIAVVTVAVGTRGDIGFGVDRSLLFAATVVAGAAVFLAATAAGIPGGLGFWAGSAGQHVGLTFCELQLAGVNSAVPALLLLGLGILAVGFAPRLTALVTYGVLAWSFLLEMLGSAIRINHWVMDTSLLHHIALAPTVQPNWRTAGAYLTVGAALGMWRFTRRDLQSE
jgi:putative exporter of polyketide antibiotics